MPQHMGTSPKSRQFKFRFQYEHMPAHAATSGVNLRPRHTSKTVLPSPNFTTHTGAGDSLLSQVT